MCEKENQTAKRSFERSRPRDQGRVEASKEALFFSCVRVVLVGLDTIPAIGYRGGTVKGRGERVSGSVRIGRLRIGYRST